MYTKLASHHSLNTVFANFPSFPSGRCPTISFSFFTQTAYSRVRNKRPGTFINFQENFHPRHAYSSHPVYLFLKLFPPTPFIYFWNFFHPPRLFRTLFFLFSNIKSWRNKKLLFNYSYKNLLFRLLTNLLFFDYPNHQVRNFTTSFFKTCTCTRCSFVSIVNGFSHLISFKK